MDRGWFRTKCSIIAPIEYDRVARVALGICRGMEELHRQGVVHADLSAFNVLLQVRVFMGKLIRLRYIHAW